MSLLGSYWLYTPYMCGHTLPSENEKRSTWGLQILLRWVLAANKQLSGYPLWQVAACGMAGRIIIFLLCYPDSGVFEPAFILIPHRGCYSSCTTQILVSTVYTWPVWCKSHTARVSIFLVTLVAQWSPSKWSLLCLALYIRMYILKHVVVSQYLGWHAGTQRGVTIALVASGYIRITPAVSEHPFASITFTLQYPNKFTESRWQAVST